MAANIKVSGPAECQGRRRGGSADRRSRGALPVAFEGELQEAVEELLVGYAAGGPQPRVDACGCKAGDGVYLVYEQPPGPALEQEVHPGHARGVDSLVGRARYALYLRRHLLGDVRGDEEFHPTLGVLRLVVVELVLLHDDLARYRDLRLFVAEHRDLYLPGVHSGLRDQAPVEGRRRVQGRPQLPRASRPVDADARAQVRGLDEAGVSQGGLDVPDPGLPVLLPLIAGEAEPLDLGEAVVGEDLLHRQLVHPDGARQHPAPDIGDARELEHALDRAVLPIGAVQDGEDNVHRAHSRGRQLLLCPGRGGGDGSIGGARDLLAPRLQLAHWLAGGDPAPRAGYAGGHHLGTPPEGP